MVYSQYPRLADPSDIPRLISREDVSSTWPPPGTTEIPVAHPERWVLISGEPSSGEPGDWYVTDLAHVAVASSSTPLALLLLLGKTFTGPIALAYGAVGHWPVIYEVGRVSHVRWIDSVVRGVLGTQEIWQFGLKWGTEGDDPDLTAAECLDFAADLAGVLTATWSTSIGGQLPKAQFSSDVKITEVGATMKQITEPVSSDGSGGNLTQLHDTQFSTYAVGSQLVGTSGSPSLPYEVSCAVTLQTNRRGASGRGRVYLPPFGVQVMTGSGKYDATIPSRMGGWIGKIAVDTKTATGFDLLIPSKRQLELHKVTTINVGLVPDSQRRRRNAQDEGRVLAWTAP